MTISDLVDELTTAETLTEGLVLLLVLFTFITFTLTLVPVPTVLGVDPNAPVVQFTIPVVVSAVVWVAVTFRRVQAE